MKARKSPNLEKAYNYFQQVLAEKVKNLNDDLQSMKSIREKAMEKLAERKCEQQWINIDRLDLDTDLTKDSIYIVRIKRYKDFFGMAKWDGFWFKNLAGEPINNRDVCRGIIFILAPVDFKGSKEVRK